MNLERGGDVAYVDAGENDQLIGEQLAADPSALGIVGKRQIIQNAQKNKVSVTILSG